MPVSQSKRQNKDKPINCTAESVILLDSLPMKNIIMILTK